MEPYCYMCTTTLATSFCTCLSTPLCLSCEPVHLSLPSRELHHFLSISTLSQFQTAEYQARKARRSEGIEAGKAALLRNLRTVDQCIAELSEKVNEIIAAVREYERTQRAELQQKRAELERAIERSVEEAELTLYEDFPGLKEPFTSLLREYMEPASVKAFSYQISTEKLPLPLSTCLRYSFSTDPKPSEQLYRLFKNSLLTYDISTGSTHHIALKHTFPSQSRYCFPSPTTLISIGGKEVISINLTTFHVTHHSQLESVHNHPGLIAICREVYIFGGYTTLCKKIRADFSIRRLPERKIEIGGFSPCRYRDEVYLPTYQTEHIELFSLITCAFRTLPLKLPHISNCSISFISSKTLITLSCSYQLSLVDLSGDSASTSSALQLGDSNSAQGACPPVAVGGKVYWFAAWTGDLVTFDIETKTVTEHKFLR